MADKVEQEVNEDGASAPAKSFVASLFAIGIRILVGFGWKLQQRFHLSGR